MPSERLALRPACVAYGMRHSFVSLLLAGGRGVLDVTWSRRRCQPPKQHDRTRTRPALVRPIRPTNPSSAREHKNSRRPPLARRQATDPSERPEDSHRVTPACLGCVDNECAVQHVAPAQTERLAGPQAGILTLRFTQGWKLPTWRTLGMCVAAFS